jgi:lysophospholipase L1-like esterase
MQSRSWLGRPTFCICILIVAAIVPSCVKHSAMTTTLDSGPVLNDQQVRRLATLRVFFGHKSVGANILQGVRDLMAADPNLTLRIVNSADPASVTGPALIEAEVGENGNLRSKNAAFAAALANGMGAQGGIAMFKYCYVDIADSTNVQATFEEYRRGMQALQSVHPNLTIVHITVPLTTAESGPKAWLKSVLGRRTARADNVKRNKFNRLLRQAYAADSIFDLAEIESTRPDGSRSYFPVGNDMIYTLAEEYTTDGGHLNELGRRTVAKQLLTFLVTV